MLYFRSIVMMFLFISLFSIADVSGEQNDNNGSTDPVFKGELPVDLNNSLTGGDVMLVSATIIGFVGFGTILATRFRPNKVKTQVVCSLIIYGATLCKIVLHLYVIFSLFRHDLLLSTYEIIMVLTAILIGAIIVCFSIISVIQQGYNKDETDLDHITDTSINDTKDAVNRTAVK